VRGRLAPAFAALATATVLLGAPAARAAILPLPPGMPAQLRRAAARIATESPRQEAPAKPIPSFKLKAGDGYRIQVATVGAAVAIAVEQGTHSKSESIYLARGTVSSRRLKASFGKLGELDMHFHPGAAYRAKGGSCRGKGPFPFQRGVFTGRFHFDGEGGYLRARAHRAAGRLLLRAQRCPGRRPPIPLSASASTVFYPVSIFPRQLEANWQEGVGAATLFAAAGAKRSFYLTRVDEAHGSVATVRFASAAGPLKDLQVNEPLTAGRVSPPAPFHGTGTYRAAPDGGVTWDGPLAVSFPGLPRYPLTGERFDTTIWRSP
jgi:hypothetical protein